MHEGKTQKVVLRVRLLASGCCPLADQDTTDHAITNGKLHSTTLHQLRLRHIDVLATHEIKVAAAATFGCDLYLLVRGELTKLRGAGEAREQPLVPIVIPRIVHHHAKGQSQPREGTLCAGGWRCEVASARCEVTSEVTFEVRSYIGEVTSETEVAFFLAKGHATL